MYYQTSVFLVLIVILILTSNLFTNVKRITLITRAFGTLGFIFYIGSGFVFYGQPTNFYSLVWAAMGCIPIASWAILIKSLNDVTDAFYVETEEKAR